MTHTDTPTLPQIARELDTLAEHDFPNASYNAPASAVMDAYDAAAPLLRDARAKVREAIAFLREAGIDVGPDPDDE